MPKKKEKSNQNGSYYDKILDETIKKIIKRHIKGGMTITQTQLDDALYEAINNQSHFPYYYGLKNAFDAQNAKVDPKSAPPPVIIPKEIKVIQPDYAKIIEEQQQEEIKQLESKLGSINNLIRSLRTPPDASIEVVKNDIERLEDDRKHARNQLLENLRKLNERVGKNYIIDDKNIRSDLQEQLIILREQINSINEQITEKENLLKKKEQQEENKGSSVKMLELEKKKIDRKLKAKKEIKDKVEQKAENKRKHQVESKNKELLDEKLLSLTKSLTKTSTVPRSRKSQLIK